MKTPTPPGLVVVLALSMALVPIAAGQSTLVVDDDGAECPGAAYASIQAAEDAAAPGDTIQVCDGTYEELVRVRTLSVTLQGEEGSLLSVDSATAGGNKGGALVVAADGVVVEGLDVERIVDDASAAGLGFTSAVEVSFDRSQGIPPGPSSVELREMSIALLDETNQEGLGSALYVSNQDGMNGWRAPVSLEASGLSVTNEALVHPSGAGGAALTVRSAGDPVEAFVDNSSFTDGPRGVSVEGVNPTLEIHHSEIAGNEEGLVEDALDGEVDARENWWGSPLGPSTGANPFAATGLTGDSVASSAAYDPWCLEPSCTVTSGLV